MIVPITYKCREKLESEWWSDYSSLKYAYPFGPWALHTHYAKLIRNSEYKPFAFEFKNQEEADKFIERYKDYLDVGKNEVDT